MQIFGSNQIEPEKGIFKKYYSLKCFKIVPDLDKLFKHKLFILMCYPGQEITVRKEFVETQQVVQQLKHII